MITEGIYELGYDFDKLKEMAYQDKNNKELKFKTRGAGIYIKPSDELQKICKKLITVYDDQLDWTFELFYSTKPVGLHNDSNYDKDIDSDCLRIAIIPIDWYPQINPQTIVMNKSCNRKIYDGPNLGLFIDAETNTEIDLKLDQNHYIDIEYYNTKLSHLRRDVFKGLSIEREYNWERNKILVFDSQKLHIASKFAVEKEWKFSLNGLGFKRR